MTWTIPPASANPSGGIVVHGDVNIGAGTGGNLQINQNSQNAIINWNSFSISANELTQFNQPGVSAAVLNRVTGGSVSDIQGALKANGNVFLINPNGILIGATGTIDVHGLTLSTLDVSNGEFLARGDMNFQGGAGSGGVTNMGRINAIGGDVFLIGKTVSNSGHINAANGTVGLAAGEEVLLTAQSAGVNGERVFVRATGAGGGSTGVMNDGTIEAAAAELKAHGNMYALAINNKGTIRATGVSNVGGNVYLRGMGGTVQNTGTIAATRPSMGSGGRVLIQAAYAKIDGMIKAAGTKTGGDVRIQGWQSAEVGGSIDVTGTEGIGGSVTVEGSSVALGSGAEIDASGVAGGGTVNVGGGFQGKDANIANAEFTTVAEGARINVDSTGDGDGGTAIVWADNSTLFQGEIKARGLGEFGSGGFVEVSGKNDLKMWGLVDASAVSGERGTALFDPGTVTVGGAGSTIPVATLNSTLDTNTNVTIATESGDVIFEALPNGDYRNVSVQWNTDASLGVFASGDAIFNNHARTAGAGSISVIAGWTGAEADPLIIANDPEAAWNAYVAAGQFGIDDGLAGTGIGNVVLDAAFRSVEVGSRYGTTNVAGNDVSILAANGGRRHAQLGFRDNGQVFYPNSTAWNGQATAGDPLVAMVGVNENVAGTGVQMFDSTGVRNDLGANGFVQYADYFGSNVNNNWWWRSLDARAGGSSGIGDNLPEMGAGVSQSLIDAGANHGLALQQADINIEARGKLDVVAAQTGDYEGAYAQVGHGGNARGWVNVNRRDAGRDYSLNWGGASSYSTSIGRLADVSGDINIRTGLDGALAPTLAAGTVNVSGVQSGTGRLNNNYAQIGHMGTSQAGSASGEISILAGGAVGVNGGAGWRSHAQIGHGVNGGHTDRNRRAGVGALADTGQTPDGKFGGGQHKQFRVFANDADFNSAALREGNLATAISAVATGPNYTGNAALYGGAATVTGAGTPVDTALDGNITVNSATGAVEVKAFEGESQGVGVGAGEALQYSYAQIGHAGSSNAIQRVSSSGTIRVTGTEVLARAGNDSQVGAYAQVGHGGWNSDGNHSGDIFVTATTGKVEFLGGIDTTFLAGKGNRAPAGAYAQLGHGGYSSTGAHFGNITVNAGDNAGTGVNFVGGNTSLAYVQLGHGGINSKGAGTTAGTAQGFTGTITVNSVGSINFAGGAGLDDGTSNSDHNLSAQLGHGGYDSDGANTNTNFLTTADWGHSGDIMVTSSDGDITFSAGGKGTGADNTGRFHWTQLGHGGYAAGGNHNGNITVTATTGNISVIGGGNSVDNSANDKYNYTQIGHGAASDQGNIGLATETIRVTAGGAVNVIGSDGGYSPAQIGNGGYNNDGDKNGNIVVTAGTGGVRISGQSGYLSQSLIGHGGYHISGDIDGDITVNATGTAATDGVRLYSGSNTYTMVNIGHGSFFSGVPATPAGTQNGSITINVANGGLLLDANPEDTMNFPDTGYFAHARVGHGGRDAYYDMEGFIDINVDKGDIVMKSADSGSTHAHTQIGHGGYGGTGLTGTRKGQIDVTATAGAVKVTAGGTSYSYSQIGHGGYAPDGTNNAVINVTAGTDIEVGGGTGQYSYAIIGNGGSSALGTHSGVVTVAADGAVEVKGGIGSSYAFAQIGNGGYNSDGTISSDVSVTAGAGGLTVEGGTNTYNSASIGNGAAQFQGNISGSTTVNATGAAATDGVLVKGGEGGEAAAATIGHFGYYSTAGSLTGAVTVDVTNGGVELEGGAAGYFAHAMIGHGGRDVDMNRSGVIMVTADDGDISLLGGGDFTSSRYSHAQIGHGGYINDAAFTGTFSDNIEVHAMAGQVTLDNGDEYGNYARIGHGGWSNGTMNVDLNGDICVVGDTGVILQTSGNGSTTYAAIGHGGRVVDGDFDGDITVVAPHGNVELTSSSTVGYTTQIGHGGDKSDGAMSGDITVVADNGSGTGGNITLTGGNHKVRYAMIGHGGTDDPTYQSTGTRGGGVHLFAGGTLTATNGIAAGNTNIYHQTASAGGLATNYLGGDGFQMVGNGGITLPDSAVDDIQAMIDGNIASGSINVALTNDIDITIGAGNDIFLNTADDFYILTGGDITMLSSYQNAGTGDFALVAGWDGTGVTGGVTYSGTAPNFNYCDPTINEGDAAFSFTGCDWFGNNNSTLTIGDAGQATAVRVGSLGGSNVAAGYGVKLLGGSGANAATQFGFQLTAAGQTTSGTSSIDVHAKADRTVPLDSGTGDGLLYPRSATAAPVLLPERRSMRR